MPKPDSTQDPTTATPRYLCLNCGQDSLVGGQCPMCGTEMVVDTEEIPGEKDPTKPHTDEEGREVYSLEDLADEESDADATSDSTTSQEEE